MKFEQVVKKVLK